MATSDGPNISSNGLVLCLDAADRNSYSGSGNTWYDMNSNSYNATLISTNFDSNYGGGIDFDGISGRGYVPSPVSSTDDQTYEVWTNCIASAGAAGGYAYILHNNPTDTSIGNSYFVVGIKPTQQYFAAFNGAYATMSSNITATNSTIRQIVLSWDGSSQYLYVNGELKDSEALPSIAKSFDTNIGIGSEDDSVYRLIDGSIYTIRAYNRALSAAEILHNFNATRKRYNV